MAEELKEELLKRIKDGLDVWDDIPRFAKAGFASIPKDDLARLKWYGIYPQRPEDDGYFMMRVKVPAGQLTGTRLREIGRISKAFGRNTGDITTRQDIQLHWIRIEDVPEIFRRLYDQLGLNQSFACGDTPRNVTCCPLAGVTKDELFDVKTIAATVAEMYFRGGKEFSNLPRKFKTAIGACPLHCHAPQINDIGFFGVERSRPGKTERGFGLMVGGGLRDTPHFAQSLRVFLPPRADLISDICRAIANIFRDCDELRHGRLRARLKFYVARVGWQAFRDQLEQRLGHALDHDDEVVFPRGASPADHVGVGQQRDGRWYVGVPIERGRLNGEDMIRLADLADEFAGDSHGRLVTTIKQNIVLLNIPAARVDDLVRQLTESGLPPNAHPLRTTLISCTGIEFCRLAAVETKARARQILAHLEEHVQLEEPLFIAVTGCPNSCAQYQIADIGLTGVPIKDDQGKADGFHVLLGAKLGETPQFGEYVRAADGKRLKIPAATIHLSLAHLIAAYQREGGGCGFGNWIRAQPAEHMAKLLCPDSALA
jgi:sulfite reductase beta subunit-like hemoprotein